jgi:predicted nucleotidyltransferase
MRLDEQARKAIVQAVSSADPAATVYLFGSRVDDSAKGGDIDLLVLSDKIDLMAKLDILGRLHGVLGEQRIDLLVFPDLEKPFARLAAKEGQRL